MTGLVIGVSIKNWGVSREIPYTMCLCLYLFTKKRHHIIWNCVYILYSIHLLGTLPVPYVEETFDWNSS